jgi:hypothetical protein
MRKWINENGKKYNRWTVFQRVPSKHHGAYFWCRCECGVEGPVSGCRLRNGESKSCGCLRKDLESLPRNEAAFNDLFNRYRAGAKKRKQIWSITKEQFANLIQKNCYYCGVEPRQRWQIRDGRTGHIIYNGLDRIESCEGYFLENIVTCCEICNKAKRDLSLKEFEDWIKRLCNYQTSVLAPSLTPAPFPLVQEL